MDAKFVVDILKKEEGNLNCNDFIVADCKEWLKGIPLFKIQYYYREKVPMHLLRGEGFI